MFSLIGLLLIPILVGGVAYFHFRVTITWKEFLLQMGVSVVLIVGFWALARANSMNDTEHWNGRITAKDNGSEHCCHSYECMCQTCCTTDANGNQTCSSCMCQTCYHHSQDYYWQVDMSTGDSIHDGCHSGRGTPAWWDRSYVNEPVSVERTYTNYLKADAESILTHDFDPEIVKLVPPFPEIQGKYHVKKVVTQGGARAPKHWQPKLMELNADLGAKKQVDVTILLTKRTDPEFAFAVEAAWTYGPKNSLNIIMGTDGQKILWARVVTISNVEELKITLRDGLQGRDLADPEIIPFIRNEIETKFHRTPLGEYEYLASAAAPSGWWLFWLYFFAFGVSIGLAAIMHRYDVFKDERWQNRRNRT